MKKIISISAMLIMSLFFTSCSNESPEPDLFDLIVGDYEGTELIVNGQKAALPNSQINAFANSQIYRDAITKERKVYINLVLGTDKITEEITLTDEIQKLNDSYFIYKDKESEIYVTGNNLIYRAANESQTVIMTFRRKL